MDERERKVADILREAGTTHHAVYRITDGDDPEWPLWYAEWLTTLSELPELLGRRPTRSELVYLLVKLDRESGGSDEPWQDVYARELVRHFGPEAR